ncbi:unnamed protein product [Mytilus coruscus]|uniref:Uncharacterized protein n=1 Tax=Mytilus coruscus TaxID=42192 RepID=A0A6J8DYE1_MYTCO|nr:unnamed protein product [Mytilus coruscus]
MVLQKVSKFGEDLSLICLVEDCCKKRAGWGKWIPNFATIFIDVRDLTMSKKSKYTGLERRNGFLLIIRRLNESDLNIDYSCTYGFEVSKKQVLLRNMTISDKDIQGGSHSFLSIPVGVVLCVSVITGIVVVLVFTGCSIYIKGCCRETTEDTELNTVLQLTGNRRDKMKFESVPTDVEEESII